MRLVLPLLVLVACDLHPPKRERTGSAGSAVAPPTATVDAAVAQNPPPPPPAVAAVDAGAAAVTGDASPPGPSAEACLEVAVHVAGIEIAAADPAQRAALEQDRTKLVRRIAEACTQKRWSDETRACFLRGKERKDIQPCTDQLSKVD